MATTTDRYKLIVDTKDATAGISRMSTSLRGLGPLIAGAFSAVGIVNFTQATVQATREFQNYRNSLSLITESSEELDATLQSLNNAAVRNRAAFGDTVELYSKLVLATEELGVSTESVLRVTGNFQKALAISGADAGTAAGAIRQFGQAMASGTVRGDEFNSIVEALGPALILITRESGLTIGELRKMSQAGELTSETFFRLIQDSKSLDAAFQATTKTISQLEQETSDAFDKLFVKFGEASGVTESYTNILDLLSRVVRELAGAQTDLEAATVTELINNEAIGSASERLDEFNVRVQDAERYLKNIQEVQEGDAWGIFGIKVAANNAELTAILRPLGLTIEKYKEYRTVLEEAVRAQGLQLESARLEAEQLEERTRVSRAALKPYQDLLASVEDMTVANERGLSPLVKAKNAQAESAEALERLTSLTGTYAGSFIPDLNEKIATATTRHSQLTTEVERLQQSIDRTTTAEGFYNNLIEQSTRSVDAVGFAREAVNTLTTALDEGKIGPELYQEAMDRLNRTMGETRATAQDLTDFLDNNAISAQERLNAARDNISLIGLEGLQRKIKEIELDELSLQRAAENRVKTQLAGADPEAANAAIAAIRRTTQETIQARQELARQAEMATQKEKDAQSTFAAGWKRAYESYADDANDASKRAERVFSETTKGMEDLIVNFAKTGKFEWRSFLSSILEDTLRSQLRQSISSIFSLPALGGGSTGTSNNSGGGLFGGYFATGGMIPGGRFGVVGENGPELVSGPANVTPDFGGSNVTYNINAVDARSFKQLVAADPGFIHAVAQKGRTTVTRGR